MSDLKYSQKCIVWFTTIARGKTLCPNANVHNNPRENHTHSYFKFIYIYIIESIANDCTFSSYTFIDPYNSTYEEVFVPAYLLGYPVQVSL